MSFDYENLDSVVIEGLLAVVESSDESVVVVVAAAAVVGDAIVD